MSLVQKSLQQGFSNLSKCIFFLTTHPAYENELYPSPKYS